MRVISGLAKGRKLKPVPGNGTRPITDRTKESLFNILGDWIVTARILDLFAGSGAVGIEALSREAGHVTFIDKSHLATRTIGRNLQVTGFAKQAFVKKMDAFKFLLTPPAELYDLIYIAPPQYEKLWARALQTVDEQLDEWLLPDGAVIIQIHPVEYEPLLLKNLTMYDERQYGSTRLCFYEWKTDNEFID
ncbi:16S rRNA (guanine(966)-N(2))-methyltransferase RsmD [Anaerolineales bacterium HSG6]|nr:16S rRNA (guanine(966)-N(2))-methyltransferase RsmD [Anaerolineales bacterium HSG6]MDM8532965.1 16S rRNA (guanine(966)-N(2))-methyltransferase RsmD [Anaerolineales bacterium HSG25]